MILPSVFQNPDRSTWLASQLVHPLATEGLGHLTTWNNEKLVQTAYQAVQPYEQLFLTARLTLQIICGHIYIIVYEYMHARFSDLAFLSYRWQINVVVVVVVWIHARCYY